MFEIQLPDARIAEEKNGKHHQSKFQCREIVSL